VGDVVPRTEQVGDLIVTVAHDRLLERDDVGPEPAQAVGQDGPALVPRPAWPPQVERENYANLPNISLIVQNVGQGPAKDISFEFSATVESSDGFVLSELREYFVEAQMVELTAAIAWENHRARFNHALGLGYQGFSEGSYCSCPVALRNRRREERKGMSAEGAD
jgi:hypothetical protein